MRRSILAIAAITSMFLSACGENGTAWFSKEASSTSSLSAVEARKADRLANISSISDANPTPNPNPSSAPGIPLQSYRMPILVYHHVRPQEGWSKDTWSWKMTVTPETFERHMQYLVDHGYQTIGLDTMMEIIAGTRVGPEKPVVITFDDNQPSQYDVAVPIMEERGLIGVFYLITKYLDSPPMLNRDKAKELSDRGHEIQAHTLTHRVMTALSDEELDFELTEGKRILEEVTGKSIYHLAYPGTAQNERVRNHTRAAGYVTATIMDPRIATEKDDLMKLPRIMMTDDTDLTKILP